MNSKGKICSSLASYVCIVLLKGVKIIRKNDEVREATIKVMEDNWNTHKHSFTDKQRKLYSEIIDLIKNIEKYSDEQVVNKLVESMRISSNQFNKSNELYTVIRESALGDFNEFITNETNKYGQANAKTKQTFEKEGLNFDKWLNPQIEDIQLEVAGKKMSIKMWDRNPQEDLFMGNKTTCCTAIGQGNAAATPVYLLNQSYNVVELYDATGNVVGMSRVFMGKVDGKPTLIMDNIELNKTYIKGMTNEELIQVRNGFFEYMNKYAEEVTADKDAQVYFYSNDIHVPHEDLQHENKVTEFVGALSQESVYVNSAGCAWINPTKLNEVGEIDWLVVPKNSSKTSESDGILDLDRLLDLPGQKTQQNITIQQHLETATSKEKFVVIPNEIKKIPQSVERQLLATTVDSKINKFEDAEDIRAAIDCCSDNSEEYLNMVEKLLDYKDKQLQNFTNDIIDIPGTLWQLSQFSDLVDCHKIYDTISFLTDNAISTKTLDKFITLCEITLITYLQY